MEPGRSISLPSGVSGEILVSPCRGPGAVRGQWAGGERNNKCWPGGQGQVCGCRKVGFVCCPVWSNTCCHCLPVQGTEGCQGVTHSTWATSFSFFIWETGILRPRSNPDFFLHGVLLAATKGVTWKRAVCRCCDPPPPMALGPCLQEGFLHCAAIHLSLNKCLWSSSSGPGLCRSWGVTLEL